MSETIRQTRDGKSRSSIAPRRLSQTLAEVSKRIQAVVGATPQHYARAAYLNCHIRSVDLVGVFPVVGANVRLVQLLLGSVESLAKVRRGANR